MKKVTIVNLFANIWVLLLLGLAVRLVLHTRGTLFLDLNTYIAWSNRLVNLPFNQFYLAWSDYLPGYLYILWLLGKLSLLGLPQILLYKSPAIIADLATAYLVYKIVKVKKKKATALLATAIFLFNPAVFANSTLWGQVDSLTSLFSILALYLFDRNIYLSALALALGVLIKPQAALVLPVVIYLFYVSKSGVAKFVTYGLIALSTFVLGFALFSDKNIVLFMLERISATLGQYPYKSVNAFNFWGIFGQWQQDTIVTTFASVAVLAVVFSFLVKSKQQVSRYALLTGMYLAGFLFMGRMHERHMLAVFAPLAITLSQVPYLLGVYLLLSLTYLLNLRYSFVWVNESFRQIFSDAFTKVVSLFNTSLLFVFVYLAKFKQGISLKTKIVVDGDTKRSERLALGKDIAKGHANKLVFLILLFALISRLWMIGMPENEYFDEVYHAFTGKVMLHGDPKAWEWWNPHPEGFAYEWTHPPLAKLTMAGSMFIFGEASFAWRLPGVLFGTATVWLIYLIASLLFKDRLVGVLSAGVFTLDGLPLVVSRIGMNDAYLLFFVLLSLYLYLKTKDFWAAVSFGLALSSKWSAIWAIPIFGLIFLSRRKKFTLSHLWFFILPPVIYLASYTQMFTTGHGLDIFWGMQKQMWWYHTNLEATHPYSSMWWQWPFLIRPIYLYTSNEVGGFVSRIYAMGNPFVFWGGLMAVFYLLYYSVKMRLKSLALVLFAYFIFFVPWAVSPRVMFLYHYLPSIPFLAIATGFFLRTMKGYIPYVFALFLVAYLYFFPHWAGLTIPLWLDKSYYWFATWR